MTRSATFINLVQTATGLECVAEHRFHPKRRWRFDYAVPDAKVAIEVEGGIFTGGRHTSGTGFRADMEKYNTAEMMGWHVLRITPDMEKYNTAEMMGWHVLRITPDMLCAPSTIAMVRATVLEAQKHNEQ